MPSAAGSSGGGSLQLFVMMALLFGAMYFFLIRPQQKRRREMESMQSTLGVGSEVVTIGGLYGTVTDVDDDTVTLEVAPGVTNRYARQAVSRVISASEEEEEPTEPDSDDIVDQS